MLAVEILNLIYFSKANRAVNSIQKKIYFKLSLKLPISLDFLWQINYLLEKYFGRNKK